MSDRARKLFPVQVAFTQGEIPTHTKLNGISTQARSGLTIVEQILGDIWNQAGDPLLSPTGDITRYALRIPNLSRAIGRTHLLNAMVPSVSGFVYNDPIGNHYADRNKAFLKYPVLTGTPVISGDGGLYDGSPVGSPYGIIISGNWYLDEAKGVFYSFDPIPSGTFIAYEPILIGDTSSSVDDLNTSGWNVIPDPSTWSGDYSGLKISYANNVDDTTGYNIWLPPRKPLDATRSVGKSVLPTTENTGTGDPDSGALFFYQDITADAALDNGDNYRYNLPPEITDASAGNTLPAGLLYLWDEEKGTIIEGVTFKCPTDDTRNKWLLVAFGTTLADIFDTYITDDTTQAPADYIDRFKLIVVGNSLARSLSVTNQRFYNHSHKNEEGDIPVDHGDLEHLVTPTQNATNNPDYPTGIPQFTPSQWAEDDHWQYLHRAGSTGGSDARDLADNAMFNRFIVSQPDYTNQAILDVATDNFTYLYLKSTDATPSTERVSLHVTTTLDVGFEFAGNSAGSRLFAGDYKIVRDATTHIANNLKFRDAAGGSEDHSAMQYVTIHAAGFVPVDGDSAYKLYKVATGACLEAAGAGTANIFLANVILPNGAEVKGFDLLGRAGPAGGDDLTLKFYWQFDTGLGSISTSQQGADLTLVGGTDTGIATYAFGDMTDETSTLIPAITIDKTGLESRSYFFELSMSGSTGTTGSSGTRSRVFCCRVAYVMPELAW